ncbi:MULTISPECIES: MarC family NAAT transporter [Enterobacteriaceae]|uniref:MarC family NAAT transporter n=1 Tax=Enterobacteriaceae TaxID=543 RepID=UPI000237D44F|nr:MULTISPECIES: MarC family NAAT transporter [Enterobacteriaceae]QNE50956.1 MarC family NAAT transporter [Klebsiella michiganensis]
MQELIQVIVLGLVMILPLANPLTSVALFLGLTGDMSAGERNRQALQASVYVFIIMMVAFYGGQLIMDMFGISIPGLRIAGGLIVSFIGFRMLFPLPPEESVPEATSKADEIQRRSPARAVNIAFVPLAMPSTAGPGTIAMIISSASQIKSGVDITPWVLTVAPVLTTLLVSLILWLCLRSSGFLMRLLGKSGIEAISRLMGFLLVCMGVQFIINGVLEIVATMH